MFTNRNGGPTIIPLGESSKMGTRSTTIEAKVQHYMHKCQMSWLDNQNSDKSDLGLANMNGIRSTQLAALVRVLIDQGVLK